MRRSHYEYSSRGVFMTSRRAKALLTAHATGLGVSQVADALRISPNAANTALVKLKRDGVIERIGLATYRMVAQTVIAPPPCVVDSFIRPPSLARLMGSR